jgi:hypothetical protein
MERDAQRLPAGQSTPLANAAIVLAHRPASGASLSVLADDRDAVDAEHLPTSPGPSAHGRHERVLAGEPRQPRRVCRDARPRPRTIGASVPSTSSRIAARRGSSELAEQVVCLRRP